jgi:ubiquinone biosynthesis protein UbiJ
VPRREGEPFLRGVDALREDVDRLEARLALLARRRANRTDAP